MGRNVEPISHLFYADDMLLFTNGKLRSLKNLRKLLQWYEKSSGQQINLQKSACFPGKSIVRGRLIQIQIVTGCSVKALPFLYLGSPCTNAVVAIIFSMTSLINLLEDWRVGKQNIYHLEEK